jgi:hypothetical protein
MKFRNWTKIISEKLLEDGLSPKFLAWQSRHFFCQIFDYIFQKNRQNWGKLFKQNNVLLDNHLSTNVLYFQIKY